MVIVYFCFRDPSALQIVLRVSVHACTYFTRGFNSCNSTIIYWIQGIHSRVVHTTIMSEVENSEELELKTQIRKIWKAKVEEPHPMSQNIESPLMPQKIDINAQNAMINEVGVAYGRVMLLGPSGVGKTSLLRGLKNEQFIQYGTSTQVADVRHIRQFWAEGYAGREWKEVGEQDELDEMAKLLAAGSHDSRSAEQIISSVKSVRALYSSSHLESANAEINVDSSPAQTEEIEKYLQNAIDRAQQLTPQDVCDLKPAPFLHIWDCGGQQVFLEVLPAFLTPRTMFLTLFDASKSFDETFHSIQLRCGEKVVEEDVGITIHHLVDTWMSMIHTYLSKKVKGVLLDYPRVSLVGTHRDQLIGDHKYRECQKMMNQMKSRYELIQSTYIVDNTTAGKGKEGEDPSYAKLRQEIYDFTVKSLVVSTPVSWVLYRKIMQMFIKVSKNIISYSEAKAIAIACKIADEDVPKALAFYHDLGVILYYPKVIGLRDKVILSPKWFVECLGKVLSLEGNENYNMPGMWELFREKGILIQSLYGAVWRNNEGDIDPQSIMELLVHLHLAAEVKTEQYQDRDVLQYFVPCVLKNFVGDAPNIKMQLTPSPVHVKFNTAFVPPGYFTRFATTVASYEACTLDFEHGIFRNRVSFLFSEGAMKYDHVTITELPDAIQVDIGRNAPDTEDYPSFSKSCQNLLEILKLSCKEVEDLYHESIISDTSTPVKIYSQLKLVCNSSECLDQGTQVHYLSIDDLSEHELTVSEKVRCEKSSAFRSLCNEEQHWFSSMKRVTNKSRISQQEMLKLSHSIGNGEDLAASLGMFGYWRQLVNNHKIENKILYLLYAFDNDAGKRDTLMSALKNLNHTELADQLAVDSFTGESTPAISIKNVHKRRRPSNHIDTGPTPSSPSVSLPATPHFDSIKSTEDGPKIVEGTLTSIEEEVEHMDKRSIAGHQSSQMEERNELSILPSDADLTRCSRYITIPCNTLAGFLSIETSVVADIQRRYTEDSVHEYLILKKWVNENSVTKQEAYDKLVALEQENAAKSIMDPSFTIEKSHCALL